MRQSNPTNKKIVEPGMLGKYFQRFLNVTHGQWVRYIDGEKSFMFQIE